MGRMGNVFFRLMNNASFLGCLKKRWDLPEFIMATVGLTKEDNGRGLFFGFQVS